MGAMLYLVQSKEGLPLISAALLADCPHEFALAPSLEKKGGRWLPRVASGVFGRFLCVCAAKKAGFLDPVQPLSAHAITMGKGKRCGTCSACIAQKKKKKKGRKRACERGQRH